MFNGDTSLTSIGDISNWKHTSRIQGASAMFKNCSNLIKIGDLGKWDMSNLQRADSMFEGTSSLRSLGDLSNWHLNNVTTTASMFSGASLITDLGNLNNWGLGKDTDMSHMFDGMALLTNLGDLSQWRTGNVTNTSHMFQNDGELTSIGDIHTWNVSNVKKMNNMFDSSGIENVNMKGWHFNSAMGLVNDEGSVGTTDMFTNLGNPATIIATNMENVPSTFKASDFAGDEPLIVINDNATLQAMNSQSDDNGGTGHPANTVNFVQKGASGEQAGTQQQAFVFDSTDALNKALNNIPTHDNLVNITNPVKSAVSGKTFADLLNESNTPNQAAAWSDGNGFEGDYGKIAGNYTVDLTKDVTGTSEDKQTPLDRTYKIIEKLPDGTDKNILWVDTTQYKKAIKDLLTGNITYGDKYYDPSGTGADTRNKYTWVHGTLDNSETDKTAGTATVDQIAGYTTTMPTGTDVFPYSDRNQPLHISYDSSNKKIKFDIFWGGDKTSGFPASKTWYITYTADPQKGKINFVSTQADDQDGETVGSQEINSTSDQTVEFGTGTNQTALNIPTGWVIDTTAQKEHSQTDLTLNADGQPTKITYDHDDSNDQTWNVYIKRNDDYNAVKSAGITKVLEGADTDASNFVTLGTASTHLAATNGVTWFVAPTLQTSGTNNGKYVGTVRVTFNDTSYKDVKVVYTQIAKASAKDISDTDNKDSLTFNIDGKNAADRSSADKNLFSSSNNGSDLLKNYDSTYDQAALTVPAAAHVEGNNTKPLNTSNQDVSVKITLGSDVWTKGVSGITGATNNKGGSYTITPTINVVAMADVNNNKYTAADHFATHYGHALTNDDAIPLIKNDGTALTTSDVGSDKTVKSIVWSTVPDTIIADADMTTGEHDLDNQDIKITFADGSTKTVHTTVKVYGGYEQKTVSGSTTTYPTTVDNGQTLTTDQAKTAIANSGDLDTKFGNNTYSWAANADGTGTVDTTYKASDSAHNSKLRTAYVIITYGDNKKQAVQVHYTVKSDADEAFPENATGTSDISTHVVNTGTTDGKNLISNDTQITITKGSESTTKKVSELGNNAAIAWKSGENLNLLQANTTGTDYTATITFADGSTKDITIKVKVAGATAKTDAPAVNSMQKQGAAKDYVDSPASFTVTNPATDIKWVAVSDDNGKYTVTSTTPTYDTTWSSSHPTEQAYVEIDYADGKGSQIVPVTLNLTSSHDGINASVATGTTLTTHVGALADNWTDSTGTTTATLGNAKNYVHLTYGTGTDATDIDLSNIGKATSPIKSITWVTKPDTSTASTDKKVTIKITFTDGSDAKTVEVPYTVVGGTSIADSLAKTLDRGEDLITAAAETIAKDSISNNGDLDTYNATYAWATGSDGPDVSTSTNGTVKYAKVIISYFKDADHSQADGTQTVVVPYKVQDDTEKDNTKPTVNSNGLTVHYGQQISKNDAIGLIKIGNATTYLTPNEVGNNQTVTAVQWVTSLINDAATTPNTVQATASQGNTDVNGFIKISYKDGSSKILATTVHVRAGYNDIGKNYDIVSGSKPTKDQAREAIKNSDSSATDSLSGYNVDYKWAKDADGTAMDDKYVTSSTDTNKDAWVVITYTDGTGTDAHVVKQVVKVNDLKITTQSHHYTPEVTPAPTGETSGIVAHVNGSIDLTSSDIPIRLAYTDAHNNTQYKSLSDINATASWDGTAPDLTVAATAHDYGITITYADGSTTTTDLEMPVTVLGGEGQLTTHAHQDTINQTVADGLAEAAISNNSGLDTSTGHTGSWKATSYQWSTSDGTVLTGTDLDNLFKNNTDSEPDQTIAGVSYSKTAKAYIRIGYSDGTHEVVEVPLKITSDADNYTVASTGISAIITHVGSTHLSDQLKNAITLTHDGSNVALNSLNDVSIDWQDADQTPSLTAASAQASYKAIITFADGSKSKALEVPVTVLGIRGGSLNVNSGQQPGTTTTIYESALNSTDLTAVHADYTTSYEWVKDENGTALPTTGYATTWSSTHASEPAYIKVSYKKANGDADGSEIVKVTLNIVKDADVYTPTVKDSVLTTHVVNVKDTTGNVPDPTIPEFSGDEIDNIISITGGTATSAHDVISSITWGDNRGDKPDFSAAGDNENAYIVLHYKDGSTSDRLLVKVNVVGGAKKSDYVSQIDEDTEYDKDADEDTAKAALDPTTVANILSYNSDATFSWAKDSEDQYKLDTSFNEATPSTNPASRNAYVIVTYHDGTKQAIQVPIKIKTDADNVTPSVKPTTPTDSGFSVDASGNLITHVNADTSVLTPDKIITLNDASGNLITLTKDASGKYVNTTNHITNVEWDTPIDVATAHTKTDHTIKISFADGTSKKQTIPVTVLGLADGGSTTVISGYQPGTTDTDYTSAMSTADQTTLTKLHDAGFGTTYEWVANANGDALGENGYNTIYSSAHTTEPAYIKVTYHKGTGTSAAADGSQVIKVTLNINHNNTKYNVGTINGSSVTVHAITGTPTAAQETPDIFTNADKDHFQDIIALTQANDGTAVSGSSLARLIDHIEWKTAPNFASLTNGTPQTAQAIIHYVGGSISKAFDIKVNVIGGEANESVRTKINRNKTLTLDQDSTSAKAALTEASINNLTPTNGNYSYPVDSYSWAGDATDTTTVDTSWNTTTESTHPADRTAYVILHYHDGSKQAVKVNIHINSDAESTHINTDTTDPTGKHITGNPILAHVADNGSQENVDAAAAIVVTEDTGSTTTTKTLGDIDASIAWSDATSFNNMLKSEHDSTTAVPNWQNATITYADGSTRDVQIRVKVVGVDRKLSSTTGQADVVTNHGVEPDADSSVTKPTIPAGTKWTIDKVQWAKSNGTVLTGTDLTDFFKDNTDGSNVDIDGQTYQNAKLGYILVSYKRGNNTDGTQLIKLPVTIKSDADNLNHGGSIKVANSQAVLAHANEEISSLNPSDKLEIKDENEHVLTQNSSTDLTLNGWKFLGWVKSDHTAVTATDFNLSDSGLDSKGKKAAQAYVKIELKDGSVVYSADPITVEVLGGYESKTGSNTIYPTTTNNGSVLTEKEAQAAIANSGDLNSNFHANGKDALKYEWSTGNANDPIVAPDVTYDATDPAHNSKLRTANVIITYGDGTKQAVQVHYNVKSDADSTHINIDPGDLTGKHITSDPILAHVADDGSQEKVDAAGVIVVTEGTTHKTLNDIGASIAWSDPTSFGNMLKSEHDSTTASPNWQNATITYADHSTKAVQIRVKVVGVNRKLSSTTGQADVVTNHGVEADADSSVTKPTIPANSKWTTDSIKWANASGNVLDSTDLTNFFKNNTDGSSVEINGQIYRNAKEGYILVSYKRGNDADGTQLIKLPITIKSDADNFCNGGSIQVANGQTILTHANKDISSLDPTDELEVKDENGHVLIKNSSTGSTLNGWKFIGWVKSASDHTAATSTELDLSADGLDSYGKKPVSGYAKIELQDGSYVYSSTPLTINVLGGVGQSKTYMHTTTVPNASDGVKNYSDVYNKFNNATYSWVENTGTESALTWTDFTDFNTRTQDRDGNLAANDKVYVKITWGDGTYQYVKAPVTIKNATDDIAALTNLKGKANTVHVVNDGTTPNYISDDTEFTYTGAHGDSQTKKLSEINPDASIAWSTVSGANVPNFKLASGQHDYDAVITVRGESTSVKVKIPVTIIGASAKATIPTIDSMHSLTDAETKNNLDLPNGYSFDSTDPNKKITTSWIYATENNDGSFTTHALDDTHQINTKWSSTHTAADAWIKVQFGNDSSYFQIVHINIPLRSSSDGITVAKAVATDHQSIATHVGAPSSDWNNTTGTTTTTSGNAKDYIQLTYSDGSDVDLSHLGSAISPISSIDWITKPDTTKANTIAAEIKINFTDGSAAKTISIPTTVYGAIAKNDIETTHGTALTAIDQINNLSRNTGLLHSLGLASNDITVDWASNESGSALAHDFWTTNSDSSTAIDPNDSSKRVSGAKGAYLIVHYKKADGRTADGIQTIWVAVKVKSDADNIDPANTNKYNSEHANYITHIGAQINGSTNLDNVDLKNVIGFRDSHNRVMFVDASGNPTWRFEGFVKASGFDYVASDVDLDANDLTNGKHEITDLYAKVKLPDSSITYVKMNKVTVYGGYESKTGSGSTVTYPTTTDNGIALTEKEAQDAIANSGVLNSNFHTSDQTALKYEWSTGNASDSIIAPDVTYDANDPTHNNKLRTANVIITYGDGTKQAVEVHYNVKSDADSTQINTEPTDPAGKKITGDPILAHVVDNAATEDVDASDAIIVTVGSGSSSVTKTLSDIGASIAWATSADIDDWIKSAHDAAWKDATITYADHSTKAVQIRVKVVGVSRKESTTAGEADVVTNHGTAPAASDAVTKPTVPAGNKWTIDSVKWADASGNALTGADLTNFFKDNTDGASVTIDGTNYSNAKAGYILVSYRRGTNADGTQLIKLPVRIKSDADNIDPSGVTFDTAHGNTVKTHANAASADPASGQITVKDSNGNTVTSWTFAGWSTKAGNSYSDISATALTNDLKDSNLNSDGVHDIDNVYAKIKLADNSVIHTPAMKIHVLGGVGQAKTYTARKPTDPAPAASDGVKNYTAMHDAFGGAAYKWVEYTGSGTPTHGAAGLSNWTNFTDRTTDAQGNLVANNNIYVEIKYSDGTYQYVKAPLTIQRASDLYGSHVTVNSNGITTHVNAPAADYAPSNGQGFTETGIPSNVTVTYAWNSTPDVTDSNLNSQGKKDETKSVKLTFTDTSTGLSSAISKEVVVHVIGGVAASEHQSVQQGDLPSTEQAQAAIGNNAALAPYHAGYSWYLQKNGAALTTADTALPAGTNSGTKQVWVKISYQKADGTADGEQWVQTTLNLTNSLSRQFHDQLSSNAVTVVKGTVLSGTLTNGSVENAVVQDPRSGYYHQGTFRVVNTPTGFPSDAVFSWASPVDTSSVGNVSTRIKVTYSDRSTDYVPAVVNVIDHLPTMAESTTPTGGEIWVTPNTQLMPTSDPGHYAKQGITNHGNMPAGTKYTWQASVDTSQPGSRLAGIVKVSYSDGSFNTAGVVESYMLTVRQATRTSQRCLAMPQDTLHKGKT